MFIVAFWEILCCMVVPMPKKKKWSAEILFWASAPPLLSEFRGVHKFSAPLPLPSLSKAIRHLSSCEPWHYLHNKGWHYWSILPWVHHHIRASVHHHRTRHWSPCSKVPVSFQLSVSFSFLQLYKIKHLLKIFRWKELIAVAVGATIMMNALVAGYAHLECFRNTAHIEVVL